MNGEEQVKKIRLILAIRTLDIGGAERQFIELCKNIGDNFELLIITNRIGQLDAELQGLNHFIVGKKGRLDFGYYLRLFRKTWKFKPDIAYTFMPDMNINLSLVKIFSRLSLRSFILVWGQFGSEVDFSAYSTMKRRIYRIQKFLEKTADFILSDGHKAFDLYTRLGFNLAGKWNVIYSGTNTNRFHRSLDSRRVFRENYSIADSDIVIGINSRLDPMKGYAILAEAAKIILSKHHNVFFFSIGYGDDLIREKCSEILSPSFSDRFIFLGKVIAPEKVLSGWDIYCSASLYGEGFSNSIIEAMSCELPVIGTYVGEAELQVGACGNVVNPGNVKELVNAFDEIIENYNFKELGIMARKRVEDNFSSEIMASKTAAFLKQVLMKK